jgi:hypothetical protein
MQIIFGKEVAEELSQRYTVLELETLPKGPEGQMIEAYCVIPAEKIPIHELEKLESWKKLHADFLHGYHTQQWKYCRDAIEHLRGKFGGEMDTFYDEIENRINQADPQPESIESK